MPTNNLKSPKTATFILQVNDTLLKIAKFLPLAAAKGKDYDFYSELLPAQITPEALAEKIFHIFHKLGYSNNPLIVSLPRSQATCRYSKVPSQDIREIEKIITLQAGRHLPYADSELVSGFEIISSEPGGYSGVNQVIVHKDVIEKYIAVFKRLSISAPRIILSSYGLCNLYAWHGKQKEPVMIVDIDLGQAEVVIAASGKMLFSRSFRLTSEKAEWEDVLISESNKTIEAFIKETGHARPCGIAFTGNIKEKAALIDLFKQNFNLPVEALNYDITTADNDVSFAGLIGLNKGKISGSLDLLTSGLKQEHKKSKAGKELKRIALLCCGVAIIFGLAALKDIDNKTKRLAMLKGELSRFTDDARALEMLDKRLTFLENRLNGKPAVLDVLSEINQAVPAGVFLTYFNYGENSRLSLRGQAGELGSVFTFMAGLEKSPLLKSFSLKVKYATKRKTPVGEIVDFEISG